MSAQEHEASKDAGKARLSDWGGLPWTLCDASRKRLAGASASAQSLLSPRGIPHIVPLHSTGGRG